MDLSANKRARRGYRLARSRRLFLARASFSPCCGARTFYSVFSALPRWAGGETFRLNQWSIVHALPWILKPRSNASRKGDTAFRRLLAAVLLLGCTPAITAAQSDPLTAALERNRHPIELTDGVLTGDGGRLLLAEGRASRFMLVGEQHGIAEVPALTSALFRDLAAHGYRHLAIETGAAVARHLNARLRAVHHDGGLTPEAGASAIADFVAAHYPGVPFYGLREEAVLLAEAVRALDGAPDVLWGLDYDVMADRYALRRLRELAPGEAAGQMADALLATTDSLLTVALETKNPSVLFMFSGDVARLSELRTAYAPAAGGEADQILELLEETLVINQLFARDGYASNVRRAVHLKRQFHRHYADVAGASAEPARVLLKFGANHLVRGRNFTETFDLGALTHELAEAAGDRAFGVLVLGGPSGEQAALDPTTLSYRAVPTEVSAWVRPLHAAALDSGWTLFDLRPLRGPLSSGRLGDVPDSLVRVIHGFDAALIVAGSTAATPLVEGVPES